MLALAIVIASLILIALLRFGIIAEYSDAGVVLWLKAAFLKIRVLDTSKQEKKKPKKKKKAKKEKKQKKNIDIKALKPGSLSEFMAILKAVGNALGRFKRRLLIGRLVLHYTAGGDDPSNVAISYGAAGAAFGFIIPVLERHFRIRKLDLKAFADFDAKEQGIYAKANVSIAVWEVFYVVFALFPIIKVIFKGTKNRKDGQKDGESPDK